MNILLIHVLPEIEAALRARGHQVCSLRPPPGILHLPSLPVLRDFTPDLLLQQEVLGPRLFLGGLEGIPCPTLFWGIDTHLNLHWQRWYSLLFDATLSPHPSLFAGLPDVARPEVTGFPIFARPRPWRPHAARRHNLAFCGIIDEHRPLRRNLAVLLEPLGLKSVSGISNAEMLDLYADARVIPNESIAGEVNFRLMEAASCGCLSLNPPVGPDQDSLFQPGEEMLVYHDGVDLLHQVLWARNNPGPAERMGQAALARALREHLPAHRAELIERTSRGLSRKRLEGRPAEMAFWLALTRRTRGGTLPLEGAVHARQGLALLSEERGSRALNPLLDADSPPASHAFQSAGDPASALERLLAAHVRAEALCLLAEQPGGAAEALDHCRALLSGAARGGGPGPSEAVDSENAPPACALIVAAAASAIALREGDFALGRAFWTLYAGKRDTAPRDPQAIYRHWAATLERDGMESAPGFPFTPEKGMIPTTALDFLLTARQAEPQNEETHQQCERLLERQPNWLYLLLGYLAESSMRDPQNWRRQTRFGLASLRALRVREGLEELSLARERARAVGRERLFEGMVLAQDLSGRTLRALADIG